MTYWADGRLKDITDPRGFVTRFDVDWTNRQNLITFALGTSLAQTVKETFDAKPPQLAAGRTDTVIVQRANVFHAFFIIVSLLEIIRNKLEGGRHTRSRRSWRSVNVAK